MDYTPEQLVEKFSIIPEDIKRALASFEFGEILGTIAENEKIHVDQMAILAEEVGLVMLGMTSPKDFIDRLVKNLPTDIETARKLTAEINTKIFAPIKDSLKKVHHIDGQTLESKLPTTDIVPQQPDSTQIDSVFQKKMSTLFGNLPPTPTQNDQSEVKTRNIKDLYREPIE